MISIKRALKIILITAGIQGTIASAAHASPALFYNYVSNIEVADLQECEDKARYILREEGLHRGEKQGNLSDFVLGTNETYTAIIDCYYEHDANGQPTALVMVTGNTSASETNSLLDTLTARVDQIR